MSVGFLLSNPSDAVIWRGPKKNGKTFSKQFYSFFILGGGLKVTPPDSGLYVPESVAGK